MMNFFLLEFCWYHPVINSFCCCLSIDRLIWVVLKSSLSLSSTRVRLTSIHVRLLVSSRNTRCLNLLEEKLLLAVETFTTSHHSVEVVLHGWLAQTSAVSPNRMMVSQFGRKWYAASQCDKWHEAFSVLRQYNFKSIDCRPASGCWVFDVHFPVNVMWLRTLWLKLGNVTTSDTRQYASHWPKNLITESTHTRFSL